jgi:hypothetical protein
MKALGLAAALALAAPAFAQIYPLPEPPMSRGELRSCMDRDAFMRDRLDRLERERFANDREGDAIAREGAELTEALRNLDNADRAAVDAYNQRSAAYNRRVDAHNRCVGDMNARAATHNADAADLAADCGLRPYLLRDRDMVLRTPGYIR